MVAIVNSQVFTFTIPELTEAVVQYIEKKQGMSIPEYAEDKSIIGINQEQKTINCTVFFVDEETPEDFEKKVREKASKKKNPEIVQLNKPNKDKN